MGDSDGKDVALSRLVEQVQLRLGRHIQHKIALCDGCPALQLRLAKYFPDFIQILDFIHANEYLWKVANALFGETDDQRLGWMKTHTHWMLSGKTKQLIAEFRRLAKQPKTRKAARLQLLATANYFERNLPSMDYPTYLAHGWPIASGVIEGACRHLVKDRCELSGCAGHTTALKISYACVPWQKTMTGMSIMPIANNSDICGCMARSRSYSNRLKYNPLPLNRLHNRCPPHPPSLIQACLWLFELRSSVNSNETHPY